MLQLILYIIKFIYVHYYIHIQSSLYLVVSRQLLDVSNYLVFVSSCTGVDEMNIQWLNLVNCILLVEKMFSVKYCFCLYPYSRFLYSRKYFSLNLLDRFYAIFTILNELSYYERKYLHFNKTVTSFYLKYIIVYLVQVQHLRYNDFSS